MFFMKNSMKTSSWTFAYLVAPLGLGKFLQIFSAVFWVHFDGYISGDIYGFLGSRVLEFTILLGGKAA